MYFLKARKYGTKVGFSELLYVICEIQYCQKSYARGNGTICSTSTYLPVCLLLRCRLCVSWLSKRNQGLRSSLIKTHHELGLDRREAGLFLST